MKKGVKRFLSVLLAAVLAVPASIAAENVVKAEETAKTIKILATSDLHGKFVAYDYGADVVSKSGSIAQLSTLIKQRRTDNTILVDVGDTIESNSADLFLQDDIHPMIEGLNQVGYDFWVAGNHEFNKGVDTLLKVAGQFKGTFMCGNVYDKENKALGESYKLVEKDGVKVAIIGFVTPNIVQWDELNLKDYKVANPLADGEMKAALDQAEKDKADVIVAALHMDMEAEYGLKGSGVYDYADAFPQIDVILAAHGHTEQKTERNGVTIIENNSQGATLADVTISVKPDGKGGYDVEPSAEMVKVKDVEEDPQIVEALASYDKRAKEDAQTVIGKLEGGNLIPDAEIPGIPQGLIQETALVSLINKVLLHYTGADIAASSLLDVNANVMAGDIKKCDTAKVYKYGNNTLYKLELTGKQLKQYMEWTAGYYNTYKEGDLTISFNGERRSYLYDMLAGISYKIDISKEAGSRIVDLKKADGTPVQDTDKFVLAINNYNASTVLLKPGNAFKEGDELPKLLEANVNAGEPVRDMIRRYIIEEAKGVITPDLYNNWEIIGNDWNEELHAKAVQLIKDGTIKIGDSDGRTTENVRSITIEDLKAAGVSVETGLGQAKITSVKAGKNSLTVKYDKVNGAEGYRVMYASKKSFSDAKSVNVKGTSAAVKKLTSGKTYYVCVRAYKKDADGKKVYGKTSVIKKVTVK